jgi:hypothetical protein
VLNDGFDMTGTVQDRKFIHDMRNSMMIVQNLSKMLADGTLQGADKLHAEELIQKECEKVIELLKTK